MSDPFQRLLPIASRGEPILQHPDAPLMEPLAMLNPQILWQSADIVTGWEGCLSVPDARSPIPRAAQLRVRYLTRDGETREADYEGFVARIIQHECDHLDGVLFVKRVEDESSIISEAKYLQMTA
jgi:peptide deformylase